MYSIGNHFLIFSMVYFFIYLFVTFFDIRKV